MDILGTVEQGADSTAMLRMLESAQQSLDAQLLGLDKVCKACSLSCQDGVTDTVGCSSCGIHYHLECIHPGVHTGVPVDTWYDVSWQCFVCV